MNSTLLKTLARFAEVTVYDDLPKNVIESIKQRLLDTVGVCLAACPLDTSQMALKLSDTWGVSDEATTIGFGRTLPASAAAFVNGVLAHSLDFDDTHLPSVLHPSACVLPAVLAAGERSGASGSAIITAAAVGYECCIRTGMAGYDAAQRNSIFFDHGWHATSICGTLGAALAVAKLNGLSCEGMEHAVAIAASMCSGLLEANRAGGSVKRLHCGWAAQAGIVAADASCAGFTGPATIFEGRFGFYEAFCGGKFDAAAITQGLGEHWSIPEIFFKPYPANHFTHAGIDAALALRDKVSIDDIDSILLRVPQPTLLTVAEPHEVKISPQTGYQAQFSGPFTVATALLGGSGLGVGLDDFTDENARDARYRSLAAKVQCHSDAECDAVFPFEFPAKLLVRTRGGKELEHKIMRNRGGPGNPLTMDELRLKYMLNASRTLPDARATELAGAIARFEQWPIEDLMKLSTAQSAPTKHYAF